MSTQLISKGGNAPIQQTAHVITFDVGVIPGADIDVSGFIVNAAGKVRSDADMCFYAQPTVGGGSLELMASSPGSVKFKVDPARMPLDADKIVFGASIHENKAKFGALREIDIVSEGTPRVESSIDCTGMTETALILAELYRRNGQWKIRVIGQGFNGGLAALATHLGVVIDDAPAPAPVQRPAPPPPPVQPATINLSKVNLTKTDKTISLQKASGKFGKIRVNLNWNQKKQGGVMGSLFGGAGGQIDLDVGCLVEDRHGNLACVQALGWSFGDFGYFPYVKLLGDDRTGAVTDGEWLDINGEMWSEFNRILIFAFIYEGAPDWQQTDGVVRIMVPDQPEIEVRMNEHGSRDPMCAVAILENEGGRIKVSREVKFFNGHRKMDEHYSWGLRWGAGSK